MEKYYPYRDITVAIPTFNGISHQLSLILEKLQSQVSLEKIAWEIIIVNNNSKDHTLDWSQETQKNWVTCPLYVINESRQGVAYCRQTAVEKSHAPIVAFLDDDNVPALDWVFQAYQFAQSHSQAGAWGGKSVAVLEKELPFDFSQIEAFLAIIDRGEKEFLYTRVLPPGAGLVVRKQAYLDCVKNFWTVGRLENCNVTSEDLQISAYMQRAGWEIWYNPNMMISHYLPQSRFTKEKLASQIEGIGIGRFPIRLLRANLVLWPIILPLYWLKDSIELLRYVCWNIPELRNKSIFAYCGFRLRWGLWISPFYFFFRTIKRCIQWKKR